MFESVIKDKPDHGVALDCVAHCYFLTCGDLTFSSTILAVSVSVGIGLFFGFYPAWNASRLNPIEALRSE